MPVKAPKKKGKVRSCRVLRKRRSYTFRNVLFNTFLNVLNNTFKLN